MTAPAFPRFFGKYVLLRPFARGGMGELFIAASGDLGGAEKLCLVKKVIEERDSPGLSARMLDEARVAVRLNHTNLVQVFDAGRVEDELYIAMELVEGRDLRAVWNRIAERRARIPLDIALYVAREMARGLEYAHGYGGLSLVHRDIAPPNVLLSWHGDVKLTDFGLARSALKNARTSPGVVFGRIGYLAPEQARGELADPRTDLFATGIVLWELLTGRQLNIVDDNVVKNLERVRNPQIKPPSSLVRTVPAFVDEVAMKALAPDRSKRFQSAGELRQALAQALGQVAPAMESGRVATFLRELFGAEIDDEGTERERLISEELPRIRRLRHDRAESSEPHGTARIQTHEALDDDEDDEPTGREGPDASRAIELTERPRPSRPSLAQAAPQRASRTDGEEDDPEDAEELAEGRRATLLGARRARPATTAPRPARADDSAAILGEEGGTIVDRQRDPAGLLGELVDNRYHVLRLVGVGGMGAVYEAEHVQIGKRVALKVLHSRYSTQADLVARFRKEARAASRIGHANIIDVTDSGTTPGGSVYFVMELLDGLDLGALLRHERTLAPDRAVHIGVQICRALSAAHGAGIIHRDLKPENIFLCSRDGSADFVKVLDFGIAQHDMGDQNHRLRLSTHSQAIGTPEYMAPELAEGGSIDARIDIYAVGAILYEALSGQPPHTASNAEAVLAAKRSVPARPLREVAPSTPLALESLVMRCLDRSPEARPQTMSAVEYELLKGTRGRGSAVAAALGLKSIEGEQPGVAPPQWALPTERPVEEPKPRAATAPLMAPPPAGDLHPDALETQRNPTVGRSSERSWASEPSRTATSGVPKASLPSHRLRLLVATVAVGLTGLGVGLFGPFKSLLVDEGARVEPAVDVAAIDPRRPEEEGTRAPSATGTVTAPSLDAATGETRGADGGGSFRSDDGSAPGVAPPAANTAGAPSPSGAPSGPSAAPLSPSTTVAAPPGTSAAEPPPMSANEVAQTLRAARSALAEGHYIGPPERNLRALLARLDLQAPGRPEVAQLRERASQTLDKQLQLQLRRGQLDAAVQSGEALVALVPGVPRSVSLAASALRARAAQRLSKRKPIAAQEDLTRALALNPDDRLTRLAQGDLFLARGQGDQAAEEYRRVLSTSPADKRAAKGLRLAKAMSSAHHKKR